MKYIIFSSPSKGEFPILFPEAIEHSFIAQCVNAEYPGIKPVSAGFCEVSLSEVGLYGKSVSLNLSPRHEDYYLIEQAIRN